MGRVRDWSMLFMISDSFEAMLTEFPYEELIDAFYVRRDTEEREEKRLDAVLERERRIRRREKELDEGYVPFFDEKVILPMRRRLFIEEEEEELLKSIDKKPFAVSLMEAEEEMWAFYEGVRLLSAFGEESFFLKEEDEGFFKEGNLVFEEEDSISDSVTLSPRERERVIESTVKKEEGGRRHEIRVEMVKGETPGDGEDADDIIEKMTERLCAMMARGSDGIYL